MATIPQATQISFNEYMANIFGDPKLISEEIDRIPDWPGSVGAVKYKGDVVEYELRDKHGKVVNYIWVWIPTAIDKSEDASALEHAWASPKADPHLGKITELYLMNPDNGKPPKSSQIGDPDLTVMSMRNLAVDPHTFVASMSDEDSFNRYTYAVSLYDGAVKIEGSKFADRDMEVGEGGKAVIDGEAGGDILYVWHRKTVDFDGGKGSDTLAFNWYIGVGDTVATVGATIDLSKGTGANPWGGTIKLTSVENVVGYYGAANTLIGNNEANRIYGGNYSDTLKGLGGNDTITVNVYFGDASVPRNLLADGGKGIDTLVFGGFFGATNILDLEHPSDNVGVFAGGEFKKFEVFRANDTVDNFTFRGRDADEKVFANAIFSKNDVLDGRGGDDLLFGGWGADTLTGGTGADRFQFKTTADSTPDAPDTITDFSHAEHDRIDLSKLYGPKLDFIGSKQFDGHAGEAHAIEQDGDTLVEVDINGDKTADFALLFDGAPQLVEGDFAL